MPPGDIHFTPDLGDEEVANRAAGDVYDAAGFGFALGADGAAGHVDLAAGVRSESGANRTAGDDDVALPVGVEQFADLAAGDRDVGVQDFEIVADLPAVNDDRAAAIGVEVATHDSAGVDGHRLSGAQSLWHGSVGKLIVGGPIAGSATEWSVTVPLLKLEYSPETCEFTN